MRKQLSISVVIIIATFWLVWPVSFAKTGPAIPQIVYTVKFSAPETHYAEIEATIPVENRAASVEVMMPIWTPGFYRVEDYASRVEGITAHSPDGKTLQIEQPKKNRWNIQTNGASQVIVSYRLLCNGRSVTTNSVGDDLAIINPGAAFMTLVEQIHRPSEVQLELPSKWKASMSGLESTPDGNPNHYKAEDYDTLVDSPIVAGNFTVHEFDVDSSKNYVVDAGAVGQWDTNLAAQDLEKIVRENRRFWGFLPYKKYVFLNMFRAGGGGLEHKASTLLTSSSARNTAPTLSWLSFVSHEYFHLFNVKRLRPIELGPFDYENPPHTSSLWISEGLTTYYGDMMVVRSGLGSTQDLLQLLSSNISQLQNSPGRLVQTLDQSSLDVWSSGTSGVGRDNSTTVSYYVKGPVVGLLLDAKIRHVTNGKKSLDDLMKLAYKRYSGDHGFTAAQFRETGEEVAGTDLKEWFRKALASTEEMDYSEMLDWFGLRMVVTDSKPSIKVWKLEIRDDATDTQKSHLLNLTGQTGK
jgi:predicted metalloprotease with PDZ domain